MVISVLQIYLCVMGLGTALTRKMRITECVLNGTVALATANVTLAYLIGEILIIKSLTVYFLSVHFISNVETVTVYFILLYVMQ